MKILVTGASGFIGTHLVPELISHGHAVTALGFKTLPNFQGAENLQGDITNRELMDKITLQKEVVIHLAAVMQTQPSQNNELIKVNVQGTENLVRACEKNQVRRFIYTSSTVSLGASYDGSSLIDEKYQNSIVGWNQFSNVAAKKKAEDLITTSQLDWNIIHFGLVYGPGDWKKSIRKSNLPVLKGRMPFYFSGGVNINSVKNLTQGLILVLSCAKPKERYILGGENITNKEFFKILAHSAHQKAPSICFPGSIFRGLGKLNSYFRINSVINLESVEMLLSYHWCSSQKAIQDLGYQPGNALTAISSSTEWIQQHELL